METGSNLDRKRSGRPSIDEETVDAVPEAFHRSPRILICVTSNELVLSQSTVHKVLHKRLRLHDYELQTIQILVTFEYGDHKILLRLYKKKEAIPNLMLGVV